MKIKLIRVIKKKQTNKNKTKIDKSGKQIYFETRLIKFSHFDVRNTKKQLKEVIP